MKLKLAIGFSILIVLVGGALFASNKYKTSTTSGTVSVASNTKQTSGTNKGKDTKPATDHKQSSAPLTADEAKLKEKYNSRFQEINTIADKRLDSLLEQAQKEVKFKKDNHLDTARIPQKYIAMLDSYEKQAKAQFDNLYKQLQTETKETKVGQAFQTEFQAKKADRNLKFQKEMKKLA